MRLVAVNLSECMKPLREYCAFSGSYNGADLMGTGPNGAYTINIQFFMLRNIYLKYRSAIATKYIIKKLITGVINHAHQTCGESGGRG